MIILYGFGKNLGVQDPSPFVLKVDAYMRISGINFTCNNHPSNIHKAPKGKLPYIVDDGKTITDSQHIFDYLKGNYVNLDENLTSKEKAQAYLLTKSLDENLYFCLVYSRWACDETWEIVKKAFFGGLPPIIRSIISMIIRKKNLRDLKGQGISRHTHKEILQITQNSFQALSDLLGDNQYFFGESPCSFDASAYSILASFIEAEIDDEFTQLAKTHSNLVAYCKNIKQKYYG